MTCPHMTHEGFWYVPFLHVWATMVLQTKSAIESGQSPADCQSIQTGFRLKHCRMISALGRRKSLTDSLPLQVSTG